MKAKRIVFRILIIVLIGVVLGSVVYTWNAKRIMRDEFPMPLGFGVSVVLTGSMEPRLHANDMVFIVKTAPADYKVGDIVLYQEGSSLVIHRIIAIDGEGDDATVTLKGDANDVEDLLDPPLKLKDLKGRMKFSIPYVGIIVRGIKSTIGVILILALAFFLFHRSWQKEKQAGDEELDKIKDEIRQLKDEVQTGGNTVDDIKAEIERLKREMAANAENLAADEAATETAATTEDAAEAAQDAAEGHE